MMELTIPEHPKISLVVNNKNAAAAPKMAPPANPSANVMMMIIITATSRNQKDWHRVKCWNTVTVNNDLSSCHPSMKKSQLFAIGSPKFCPKMAFLLMMQADVYDDSQVLFCPYLLLTVNFVFVES